MIIKATQAGFSVDLNCLKRKDMPKHINVLEAGRYIHQFAAGVYGFLPNGARLLMALADKFRFALNGLGYDEVHLPIIQPQNLWRRSGRSEKFSQTVGKIGDKFFVSPTSDEMVCSMAATYLKSSVLPVGLYRVGPCFRQEIRPKNGLLRSSEFMLLEGYAYADSVAQKEVMCLEVKRCLAKIFAGLGLLVYPVHFLSDGSRSWSTEYVVTSDSIGEKRILHCLDCDSRFRYPQTRQCVCGGETEVLRGIEFADVILSEVNMASVFNVAALDCNGRSVFPEYFSFGIGLTKLLASIIEVSSAEFFWPADLSPFAISIVQTRNNSALVGRLVSAIDNPSQSVLVDDRNISSGRKIAELSEFGVAIILIPRLDGLIEVIDRRGRARSFLSLDEISNISPHV